MDGMETVRSLIFGADGGDSEAAGRLIALKDHEVAGLDCEEVERMAADGSQWAAVLLGRMKEWALGTDHDDSAAARLYESAAKDGNAYAMAALGRLYERGEGVQKSLYHAYLLYSASSSRGWAAADGWLAKNRERAEELGRIIDGADAGDAECQFLLAKAYDDGEVLEHSEDRAVNLYAKSADQGYAPAAYEIARRCEYGDGIRESMRTAIHMHVALADSGFQASADRLAGMDLEELEMADIGILSRMSEAGSEWAGRVLSRLSRANRTVFRSERPSDGREQDGQVLGALRAGRRGSFPHRPVDAVRRVRRFRRLPSRDGLRRISGRFRGSDFRT